MCMCESGKHVINTGWQIFGHTSTNNFIGLRRCKTFTGSTLKWTLDLHSRDLVIYLEPSGGNFYS